MRASQKKNSFDNTVTELKIPVNRGHSWMLLAGKRVSHKLTVIMFLNWDLQHCSK